MPPSFAIPFDSILADPVLSLSVAAAKRKPLAPLLPFESVPVMDEFIDTLLECVDLSLSHSFGADFWRSEGAGTWKEIREEVCLSLELALDFPTELSIFQACNDLLLAPARFLSFLGFTRPPVSDKKVRNPTLVSVKLASEAIKRGQSGKALRILTGTGVAPHTSEQLARTAELFPEPKKPVFYIPTDETLALHPSFFLKKFSKLVSAVEPESPDVFGWDPTLFRDLDASSRFIPVVSRFLASFAGWAHAPPICSQLFACSSLVSIYKLHEAERDLLPPAKKHGIRPIGGQCLFGKMLDREVNDTEDAKEFRSTLLPVQRGFLSRGVSSIPMAALGALKLGHAVAKGDVMNAFQEICRQAALNNIQRKKPALANYYARTLLTRIPMITRNVSGQIVVIWSSTGAPQGSVSGTTIYDAGVSMVYETLRVEFPTFFLCAATDDLIQFFKPDENNFESWQAQYALLAKFLLRYEELAWEWCSLRQNLSKSALILPANAPLPSPAVRDLFPPEFKFHHVSNVVENSVQFPHRTDGLVICGAPVGSDFYIDAFVRWKLKVAIDKLHAISLLGASEIIPSPKHVAFKLLASSGIKLMSYVATVVAPQFTMPYLKKFDNTVRTIFFNLLYSDRIDVSQRIERSYHRATLPVGKGGLGLLRVSVSAAALWWTNLRSLQADATIFSFLSGLDAFVPDALNFITANLGGAESKFCLDVAPLLLSEVYSEAPEPPPKKLLRDLLFAHGNFQHSLVLSLFGPDRLTDDGSLTKSDVIGFNARSNLNLVFNSKRLKNLSNGQFVKLTSVYLGLPPTLERGNAQIVAGFDYPVESCMTAHGKNSVPHLDANADHHSGSCPSAAINVSRRHTNLTSVLIKYALEAGAITKREPSPYNLCHGLLSAGQCSKIFPKKVSAGYKKKASEILNLLAQPSIEQAKVDALYDALPPLDPENSASLRVDIAIENPSNQKVYLIDGSFIHTSCAMYRDAEFKGVSKRVVAEDDSQKKNASNPLMWEPSTSILDKAKLKVAKYAPLMQIMHHFQRDGRLDGIHSFVPFIVSSLGELSREAFCFVEELVAMYRFKVSSCEAVAFPLSPNQAVADFRNRLKLDIMRVAAVGLANIACSAGKPFGNRAIYAVH